MDLAVANWKSVNFDNVGFNANFEGLAGIEECTDYGIISKNRRKRVSKKGNKPLKRTNPIVENYIPAPKKSKSSITNGFEVEEVISETLVSPSKGSLRKELKQRNNGGDKANQNKKEKKIMKKSKNIALEKKSDSDETREDKTKVEKDKKNTKKTKRKKQKKKKVSDENLIKENNVEDSELKDVETEVSLDDMQAWSRFNLPDSILKGLAVQNFKNPTLIQEMTLPSALFGRRDILGAAETGSGKTLAFGLPILNAILQMKEKPFMGMKETFRKPKRMRGEQTAKKNEQAKIVNFNKLSKDEKKKVLNEIKQEEKMQRTMKSVDVEMEDQDSEASEVDSESESDEEDLKIDTENSESEEDDQDDLENYSDMDVDNDMDSELDDASDSENNESDDDALEVVGNKSKTRKTKKYDSGIDADCAKSGTSNDESDFEEKEEAVEGVNDKGIGCVKVIDNIISEDLPQNNFPKTDLKPLYALILTPTRELAIQVKSHLTSAAKYTGISVAVVVGGMSQEKQERLLSRGPEVVVATPGRLWQLIQMGNPHLSQIPDIKFLAIDETDRMLEHGHFEELHQLLERINEDDTKRGSRQNFVFSATLTMVHDLPKHLKKKRVTKKGRIINKKVTKLTPDQKLKKVIDMLGISDPKIVDITTQNQGTSTTLMECRIVCSIEQKDYYLYYVLKRHPGRTIVFCNSIGCVKRLSQLFGLLQCTPLPLHANMQQRQRLKNLDKFRADTHGVLVATDVAARGLDIPDVEHVIHYQVPRTAENYVHRSGRTARASKEGITILIMEAGEVQNYNKMCKTLEKKEDLPHFPVDNPLLSAVMQRVDAARELDLMMLKIRKDNTQKGWLEKAAKEMDMLLDENNMPKRLEDEASTNMKKALSLKRKHLNSLLATPLFPKGFSFKYPSSNILLQEALGLTEGQNAIQALRTSLEIGAVKKKNTTKNEALLKLEKKIIANVKATSQTHVKDKDVASNENIPNGEKVSKNKWKKMRKNKNN